MIKKAINLLSGLITIFIILFSFQLYNTNTTKYFIGINAEAEQEVIKHGPRNKKSLAITFDDGPHPRFTPAILDILKKYDIKATFFVLGKHAEYYPNTLIQVKEAGHEIGNHSYSHVNLTQISNNKIENEFDKTQNIIYEITGAIPKIFRPPFGHHNESIRKIASDNNCKIILWTNTQDTKDWAHPGKNKIVNTVLSNIQNGDIILFHDYVDSENETIEALDEIIPKLKEEGYNFVTITEMIQSEETKKK